MRQIPLQQLPNQALSVLLDDNQWNIVLKSISDTTAASLTLNGAVLLENVRCVAGAFLIPSVYEEAGNFLFVTQNYQLPYYTQFGVTQSLVYASATEIATLRAPTPPPITAADFNPIAALPLRFSPQGYVAT